MHVYNTYTVHIVHLRVYMYSMYMYMYVCMTLYYNVVCVGFEFHPRQLILLRVVSSVVLCCVV